MAHSRERKNGKKKHRTDRCAVRRVSQSWTFPFSVTAVTACAEKGANCTGEAGPRLNGEIEHLSNSIEGELCKAKKCRSGGGLELKIGRVFGEAQLEEWEAGNFAKPVGQIFSLCYGD